MILSGELKPGDRIVESRFARQLGVGQPTVREALVALEHQGLVSRKTNRGCMVTELSRTEISDILRLRSELEALAVELAIENASESKLSELLAAARRLLESAHAGDVPAFCELDRAFHELLWECSGNAFLPKVCSQVMIPLLAFLFIRTAQNMEQINLVRSAMAHVHIVEAILTRDKARARSVAESAFRMFAGQHSNSPPY